jgi:hypothetical protein
MKPKTIQQLAEEAARRVGALRGTPQWDYFCAGFARGVRCARNRIGAVMHKGRLVSAIKD